MNGTRTLLGSMFVGALLVPVLYLLSKEEPKVSLAAPPAPATPVIDRAQLAETFFQDELRPLLRRYCMECHAGKEPESELRLDLHESLAEALQDRKRWRRVVTMLGNGRMPPPKHPQPPRELATALARRLDEELTYVDCAAPRDPGHVTIRRLNRAEYRNTIRDLLGIEIELGDEFPMDDVGYGFDTIGEVLSMPPLLMEKFLIASQDVSEQLVASVSPAEGRTVRLSGDQLDVTRGADLRDDEWVQFSEGEIYATHDFPRPGKYNVRIRAYGDQAGDEPVRMALSVDHRRVKTFDVRNEDQHAEFSHEVELQSGRQRVAIAFINDFYRPEVKDPRRRDRNLIVADIEIDESAPPPPVREPQVRQQVFFVEPGEETSPQEAAQQILRRVAGRAFRRPATDAEVERLVRLFAKTQQKGRSFQQAIALAVQAMLASPHFLFKVELNDVVGADPVGQQINGQPVRELNDYELATRLSYFLWSSMPDDELLREAAAGTLRQHLETQVTRMLVSPKSGALSENFAVQWLGLRQLASMQPDLKSFPDYDDELQDAMRTESTMVFNKMIRENRPVTNLIDAEFTYLNERLARHYGVPDVRGPEFRRVAVKQFGRGGVFTQASVLTVTSNPTRTSPVKRGKWILENLLGAPPESPPADVPDLEETPASDQHRSVRQRTEAHRANAACAVCHEQMDPLGFSLENFDGIGAWRTKEFGVEIDASGSFKDGTTFQGPDGLRSLLQKRYRDDFVRCLAEKLLTYAIGRGMEYYDRCATDEICAEAEKDNYRISALILAIIKSDPFQKHRPR